MQKGLFTVSVDLELAWGICDQILDDDARRALSKERQIVKRLLNLMEEYEIRASWGVVGHLLQSESPWKNGTFHPEIPRPMLMGEARDWFFQVARDTSDPLWYGRDLINMIKSCSPEQEIGSHSFCHVIYDEEAANQAAIMADIRLAKEIHAVNDLPFDFFIFPRNVMGFKDILAKNGIKVYRGHEERWYESLPCKSAHRLLNLAYYLLSITPPTVKAKRDEHGLINIPASMLFIGRAGLRGLIPNKNLAQMAIAGIDLAVKKKEIFHLWFHPSNFAYNTELQFQNLENIFRQANK
ncbi:MAG: hypothetical protein HN472_15875, partial [Nitrospina sp.]|nr:hypothetical protein [Nitrospina sp.]MBT4047789.1 hypothetical protein [Nitrospina sp.]MBT4556117.1 hypothetical protein [Nitrospina sp.]MBT6739767.1 hypothetical protein [Nitrospina sp.]MBT7680655.1 hypothetical protein [Nitrospina sp.]